MLKPLAILPLAVLACMALPACEEKHETPEATIYAAIIREIRDKGVESRFAKKDRGLFQATAEAKR